MFYYTLIIKKSQVFVKIKKTTTTLSGMIY